jgi:hypothetical protein
MRPGFKVGDEKHGQLARRQIRTIPAHRADDGVAQNTGKPF